MSKKVKWKQYSVSIKVKGLEIPIEVSYSNNKFINWIITRFKPKRYTTMGKILEQKRKNAEVVLDAALKKELYYYAPKDIN